MKFSERLAILPAFGLMLGLIWSMASSLSDWYDVQYGNDTRSVEAADSQLIALEIKLRPLAELKRSTRAADWLAHHEESGQTFADYQSISPVHPDPKRSVIYLALIGDFTPDQAKILDLTRDYMERFFGMPVRVANRISLASLPARATRIYPAWGSQQILTGYVLNELLGINRPDNAVAYLAFTSADLSPGEGWNFVFGQANLREGTGVWSIHRFGDPSRDPEAFQLCLRRTMNVATHETGHIFTIQHCTTYECNMNGSNSLAESDLSPMHYCPTCTRKLCWNLKLDPSSRFESLAEFWQ